MHQLQQSSQPEVVVAAWLVGRVGPSIRVGLGVLSEVGVARMFGDRPAGARAARPLLASGRVR